MLNSGNFVGNCGNESSTSAIPTQDHISFCEDKTGAKVRTDETSQRRSIDELKPPALANIRIVNSDNQQRVVADDATIQPDILPKFDNAELAIP
jgi:hypothetical protein